MYGTAAVAADALCMLVCIVYYGKNKTQFNGYNTQYKMYENHLTICLLFCSLFNVC